MLDELWLFERVARLGSLTAAGQEAGISASAVSKALTRLEERIGRRLLARSTRAVTLTRDGLLLLRHAGRMHEEWDAALSALQDGVPSGLLRVTAPASFGRLHLSPLLPDFLALYPAVRLDLMLTEQVVDLATQQLDVAIRIAPLPDSALIARRLAPNRRILCAAPAYLQQRGTPAHPADLLAHDCLLMAGQDHWTLSRGEETLTVSPVGRLRADHGEVLSGAVTAGLGIALKSTWDVGPALLDGRLVPVLPDWQAHSASTIWALRLDRTFTPSRVTAFIDFLALRLAARLGLPPSGG